MSRKYSPELGGAENFPSVSDPKADTSSKDIAAGDRHAKEQHDRLKDKGYTGWPYDESAIEDYNEQERAHMSSSGW